MFAGTLYRMIDPKGRVVVPDSFRRGLGPQFVVTRGAEGCLLLLTEERWQAMAERHADDGEFLALLASGATAVSPCPHTGRIQLTTALREWAGLKGGDEVALAGIGDAVAVSLAPQWNSLLRQTETRLVEALIGGPVRERVSLWTDRLPGGPLVPVRAAA